MTTFSKAQKSEAKARVAMCGPSGSGKTFTSLIWARVLADGGPVALIDTERGSSRKYADLFDFDLALIEPPYHPDKLVEVLAAAASDYPVVVVDSLTHFWSGPGGVLEIVDQAKARFKGNSHAAWQVGTPIQQRMVDAVLTHPAHVVAAMRSKTEWLMQEGAGGKTQPVKVGLAPQQRDGIEYEFDLMLDIDLEHRASVGKTRFDVFADRTFTKGEAESAATEFAKWLGEGEPLADLATRAAVDQARRALTPEQKQDVWRAWQESKLPTNLALMTESQATVAQSILEAATEAKASDAA